VAQLLAGHSASRHHTTDRTFSFEGATL
jgi:hypothetical protein